MSGFWSSTTMPVLLGALGNLFRSVGRNVALFGPAAELLEYQMPDAPCCLVLDVRLRGPERTGPAGAPGATGYPRADHLHDRPRRYRG
ncbi:hypothetical protein ACU4GD_32365 [Cupriavidus basilensis]